jgi:hypothetical protein
VGAKANERIAFLGRGGIVGKSVGTSVTALVPVEKLRMDGYHNGYGARIGSTQGFAEKSMRGAGTARKDRRKPGVTRRNEESELKIIQKYS